MTYKMSSKLRMMEKDNNISQTAAPQKRNTVRRILKKLTLNQPHLMQIRTRYLHPLPCLSSHLIHPRQEKSQRRIQDRPPMKDPRQHIRYPHHIPTLPMRCRLYRNRLLLVTNSRGRRGQVCWRKLSVRQDHHSSLQRVEMKIRSIWQIGRK
jgi:hypothetical protein